MTAATASMASQGTSAAMEYGVQKSGVPSVKPANETDSAASGSRGTRRVMAAAAANPRPKREGRRAISRAATAKGICNASIISRACGACVSW
jgi:hypothetical protein